MFASAAECNVNGQDAKLKQRPDSVARKRRKDGNNRSGSD
jgi:hypothetical protein